jgi:hypothetical protein
MCRTYSTAIGGEDCTVGIKEMNGRRDGKY